MYPQWNLLPLETLGALRVRGRDVVGFLQGQLSSDVTQLDAARSLPAGYHNPQGRVLALMRLFEPAPGEVLALLPRELVTPVMSRLRAFVLRSKVELADDSSSWRIEGLVAGGADAPAPSSAAHLPATMGAVARLGESLVLRVGDRPARWLSVSPAGSHGEDDFARWERALPALWQRHAIENGEPEVYAATSGEFVAQMLNLDVLGAIAFDKGCYTGQEVIARAHYRGRVKRRLQRFRTVEPRPLQPGDTGELHDRRAFRVVAAVRLADGSCEFLAVAPLAAAAAPDEDTPAPARASRLDAVQQPLPYELPE
jgi:folate-binding protein YgfZ